MSGSTLRIVCFVHVWLVLAGAVLAEWPDDPAVNSAIGDRTGEQVQPKLAAHPDGGTYVSWFDNAAGGYDVYLQRLDAAGNELWTHNGVLLADRGFGSTQDYDLDTDTAGNALLTFRDDRSGSPQITATKVSPDGVQLWGPTGVQLTSGGSFVAAPKIAGTTDGQAIVAWTSNSDVKLQKLDADGNDVWGAAGVTIPAIGGDGTSASDLDASDAGGAILSMVRGFMFPKHLHAQKFDTDGNGLWGAVPPAVFDGGALQTANFPQFVPDGSGGAVFTWYSVGPLQCHASRVLADGSEPFGHNGVVVSTAPRDRTAPDVSFNAATGETFVVWREELGGPNPQFGIYGQKLDAGGARQWTDSGVIIEPRSTTELVQVRQVARSDGLLAFWVETLAFGNQRVHAARIAGDGSFAWSPGTADVSTVASGKSRLTAAAGPGSSAVLVWSDARNDMNDIYGQNINGDGTLGAAGPVPALSMTGLLIMSLALAVAGATLLRRRKERSAIS